jgi:hypothetical protein
MRLVGLALFDTGATAPSFPHIACTDGYAWMDEEVRRPCFSTTIATSAIIVAHAIDPPPDMPAIDRIIACAQMNGTQLARLFSAHCAACGADHFQIAAKRIRVLRHYIHPGAIDHIRRAKIPERFIRQWHFIDEPELPPNASPKQVKVREERERSLPVWRGDPERTLAAQIAWAMQYEINEADPQRKGGLPRAVRLQNRRELREQRRSMRNP